MRAAPSEKQTLWWRGRQKQTSREVPALRVFGVPKLAVRYFVDRSEPLSPEAATRRRPCAAKT